MPSLADALAMSSARIAVASMAARSRPTLMSDGPEAWPTIATRRRYMLQGRHALRHTLVSFVGGPMRAFVAGASAARHAGELARTVRCGVGQFDAVTASQTAAMADGCVAQNLGQLPGKGGTLLVHNSMLKPSRSIKMLTFMLLAAVGRLDGDKRVEERRRNCCKGCCARSSTKD